MQVPLVRLQCGCNSYEWGKLGSHSAAAQFAAATDFKIDEKKPYAELWMGTHPSLPSKDIATGRSLLDMVQDNEALMSSEITKRYGGKLPFLFKVLSISKALSIQAHPNKRLAEQLHAKDSKNYPDDNHKPEMTIAVTPFDGLCGFRPLNEIAHFLKTIPPLADLVGSSTVSEFTSAVTGHEDATDEDEIEKNKKALQKAFSSLMDTATKSPDKLKSAAAKLVQLAKDEAGNFAAGGGPGPNPGQELSDLVLRLNDQFPEDAGLFVFFFLNYVKLKKGEAMFLRADDIHAYLSGDIIECMASSDNVVRAGFTPKFKDVDTLTSMLTYNYAPISEQKMEPEDYPYVKLDRVAYSGNSSCILYDPPIEEFSVVKTELSAAGKATFDALRGPSIVICTEGQGWISIGSKRERMGAGYVFFVGASATCGLEAVGDGFVTFKAFCELDERDLNGSL